MKPQPSFFASLKVISSSSASVFWRSIQFSRYRYSKLYKDRVSGQRGLAPIAILLVLALLAIVLPVTVRYVQLKQEIRSRAVEEGGGPYPTPLVEAKPAPETPAPAATSTPPPTPPPATTPPPAGGPTLTPTPPAGGPPPEAAAPPAAPTPPPTVATGGCLPDDEPCRASREAFDSCKNQNQPDEVCWHSASDSWLRVEGENGRRASRGDASAQQKAQQWFVMHDVEDRASRGDPEAQKIIAGYENPDQLVVSAYAGKVENCIDTACQRADVARKSCQDYQKASGANVNCEAQAHTAYDAAKARACATDSDECRLIIDAENLGPAGVAEKLGLARQVTKSVTVESAIEKLVDQLCAGEDSSNIMGRCRKQKTLEVRAKIADLTYLLAGTECGKTIRVEAERQGCEKTRQEAYRSPVALASILDATRQAYASCTQAGAIVGDSLAYCMTQQGLPYYGYVTGEDLLFRSVRKLAAELCTVGDVLTMERCRAEQKEKIQSRLTDVVDQLVAQDKECNQSSLSELAKETCRTEKRSKYNTPENLAHLAETSRQALAQCRDLFGVDLQSCMALQGIPILGGTGPEVEVALRCTNATGVRKLADGSYFDCDKGKKVEATADTKEQEAWSRIQNNLKNLGVEEAYLAKWQQGQIKPTEIEKTLQEKTDPSKNPLGIFFSSFLLVNNITGGALVRTTNAELYEKTRTQSLIASQDPETKKVNLEALKVSDGFKAWTAKTGGTVEDYQNAQMAALVRNEADFRTIGIVREDTKGQIVDQLLRGQFDALSAEKSLVQAKANPVTSFAVTGFGLANALTGGWYGRTVLPESLQQGQREFAADLTLKDLETFAPGKLQKLQAQIQDPTSPGNKVFQSWQAQPENKGKTARDFQREQLAQAIDITDKAQRGELPAAAGQFVQEYRGWLRDAALSGRADVTTLAPAFKEFRSQSTHPAPSGGTVVDEELFNRKATVFLVTTYENSLDSATKKKLDNLTEDSNAYKDWQKDSKNQGKTLEAFRMEQVLAYQGHKEDIDLISSAQGGQPSLSDALVGGNDYIKISHNYDIADPITNLLLLHNRFTNGSALRGGLLIEDAQKRWNTSAKIEDKAIAVFDVGRGGIMIGAKPAFTVASVAVPALRAAQLGLSALAAPAVLQIGGESLGLYFTGDSLANTAEVCTFRSDMDTGGCLRSAGMTAFSAVSTGLATRQLNGLVVQSRALGNAQQAAVAATAETGSLATVPQVTREGLASSAESAVQNVRIAYQSTAPGPLSPVIHKSVNALGATVFGAQAIDTCAKEGITSNCLLNTAMATVSLGRFLTPSSVYLEPQSKTVKFIEYADRSTNVGFAATSCLAASRGLGSADQCAAALGGAGLSVGGAAVRPGAAEKGLAKPRVALDRAIQEAVNLRNIADGQTVTLGGRDVVITAENRLGLQGEVKNRLQEAIIATGRADAQIASSLQLPGNKTEWTRVDRALVDAQNAWKDLFERDGTPKQTVVDTKGNFVAVTPEKIEAARRSLIITGAARDIELAARRDPRGFLTQLTDQLGGDTLAKDFQSAQKDFLTLAKTEEPTSPKYKEALTKLAQTQDVLVERGFTPTQREITQKITPLEVERKGVGTALDNLQKETELVQSSAKAYATLADAQVKGDPAVIARVQELFDISRDPNRVSRELVLQQTRLSELATRAESLDKQIIDLETQRKQAGSIGGRLGELFGRPPTAPAGGPAAPGVISNGLRQGYRLTNSLGNFVGNILPKPAEAAPVKLTAEAKNLVETLAGARLSREITAVSGSDRLLALTSETVKSVKDGQEVSVQRTKFELTDAGRKAGLGEKDLSLLNEITRAFENWQAGENPRFEKLRAEPGGLLDQANFVVGALEQFGIKGSRGAIFGALPGLGKTDVVIPLNVLVQARMTGDGQFVIFPDKPLMDQFLRTNKTLVSFYETYLGKDSVLVLGGPGEPLPSLSTLAKAKVVIASRDIAFALRNTDTAPGQALRSKWRNSYVHGDEIHWTFNPFENYLQTFGEVKAVTGTLEGQGYLRAKDAVTNLPSIRELIEARKAGQTSEGVIKLADQTGRFTPERELRILKDWLNSKGEALPAELKALRAETDIGKLERGLRDYLDTHAQDATGTLGQELTVINKLADVLSGVPGLDYGPATLNGKTIMAPREQGHVTGRQYQGIADQLLYNTIGAEITKSSVDLTNLTVSSRSRDINFAQLMFEPKGFALYTGTPELVARQFKQAYGIELTQFTGPAYEVVKTRLQDGNSSVYNALGDAVAHQDLSKNQVYINLDNSRSNDIVRSDISQLHRNQKMFVIGGNGEFVEGDIGADGAFHEVRRFSGLSARDSLNERTRELDASASHYIKLYEYGAHTGVDTFNNVDLTQGIVIVGGVDQTTFAQGVNRLRPNDQGRYPRVDLVFLGDPAVARTLEGLDQFLGKNESQNLARAEVLFKESLLRNSVDILINDLVAKAQEPGIFGLGKPDAALTTRLEELRESWKRTSELAYNPVHEQIDAETRLSRTLERVKAIYSEIEKVIATNPRVAAAFDVEAGGFRNLKVEFASTVNEEYKLGARPTLAKVVDLINQTSAKTKFAEITFSERGASPQVVTADAAATGRPVNVIADIDRAAPQVAGPVVELPEIRPITLPANVNYGTLISYRDLARGGNRAIQSDFARVSDAQITDLASKSFANEPPQVQAIHAQVMITERDFWKSQLAAPQIAPRAVPAAVSRVTNTWSSFSTRAKTAVIAFTLAALLYANTVLPIAYTISILTAQPRAPPPAPTTEITKPIESYRNAPKAEVKPPAPERVAPVVVPVAQPVAPKLTAEQVREQEHLKSFPRPRKDNGLVFFLSPEQAFGDLSELKQHHVAYVGVLYLGDEKQAIRAAVNIWEQGNRGDWIPILRFNDKTTEGGANRRNHYVTTARELKARGIPAIIQIFNEPGNKREGPGGDIFGKNWAGHAEAIHKEDPDAWIGLQILSEEDLTAVLKFLPKDSPVWEKVVFLMHNYGTDGDVTVPPEHVPGSVAEPGFLKVLKWAEIFQKDLGFVPPIIGTEGGWESKPPQGKSNPTAEEFALKTQYIVTALDSFRTHKLPNGQELPDYFFGYNPSFLYRGSLGTIGSDYKGFALYEGLFAGDEAKGEAIKKMPTFTRQFSWDLPTAQAPPPAGGPAAPSTGAPGQPVVSTKPTGAVSDVTDTHPDINLQVRGWSPAHPILGGQDFIDVPGPTDPKAPQINTLIGKRPQEVKFTNIYQVNFPDGKTPIEALGPGNDNWGVTMAELEVTPGQPLQVPTSGYGDVTVLRVADHSMTIHWGDEDKIINESNRGFTMHIEDFDPLPSLLAKYNQAIAAGRTQLPKLKAGQVFGYARGNGVKVVIRDSGTFVDIRSRKDWWHGTPVAPINEEPVLANVRKIAGSPVQPVKTTTTTAAGAPAQAISGPTMTVAQAKAAADSQGIVKIDRDVTLSARETYDGVTFQITKSGVTLNGNNATVKPLSGRHGVIIRNEDNVTVTDFTVIGSGAKHYNVYDGASPNDPLRHLDTDEQVEGVFIRQAKNIRIDNAHTSGDVLAGFGIIQSEGVLLTNSTNRGAPFGVFLDRSSRNVLAHNTLSENFSDRCGSPGCETAGIALIHSSDDNYIVDNTISHAGNGVYVLIDETGENVPTSNNNWVIKNQISTPNNGVEAVTLHQPKIRPDQRLSVNISGNKITAKYNVWTTGSVVNTDDEKSAKVNDGPLHGEVRSLAKSFNSSLYSSAIIQYLRSNKYIPASIAQSGTLGEVPGVAGALFAGVQISEAISDIVATRNKHPSDIDGLNDDLNKLQDLQEYIAGKAEYKGTKISARLTSEIGTTRQMITVQAQANVRRAGPFSQAFFATEQTSAAAYREMRKFTNNLRLAILKFFSIELFEKERDKIELEELEKELFDRQQSPLITIGNHQIDPLTLRLVAINYPGPAGIDFLLAYYRGLPENTLETDAQLIALATKLWRFQKLNQVKLLIPPGILEPSLAAPSPAAQPEAPAAVPPAPPPAAPAPAEPAAIAAQINALDENALTTELVEIVRRDKIDLQTPLNIASYKLVAGKVGIIISGPQDENYPKLGRRIVEAIRDKAIPVAAAVRKILTAPVTAEPIPIGPAAPAAQAPRPGGPAAPVTAPQAQPAPAVTRQGGRLPLAGRLPENLNVAAEKIGTLVLSLQTKATAGLERGLAFLVSRRYQGDEGAIRRAIDEQRKGLFATDTSGKFIDPEINSLIEKIRDKTQPAESRQEAISALRSRLAGQLTPIVLAVRGGVGEDRSRQILKEEIDRLVLAALPQAEFTEVSVGRLTLKVPMSPVALSTLRNNVLPTVGKWLTTDVPETNSLGVSREDNSITGSRGAIGMWFNATPLGLGRGGKIWNGQYANSAYSRAETARWLLTRFTFIPMAFVPVVGPALSAPTLIVNMSLLFYDYAREFWWPMRNPAAAWDRSEHSIINASPRNGTLAWLTHFWFGFWPYDLGRLATSVVGRAPKQAPAEPADLSKYRSAVDQRFSASITEGRTNQAAMMTAAVTQILAGKSGQDVLSAITPDYERIRGDLTVVNDQGVDLISEADKQKVRAELLTSLIAEAQQKVNTIEAKVREGIALDAVKSKAAVNENDAAIIQDFLNDVHIETVVRDQLSQQGLPVDQLAIRVRDFLVQKVVRELLLQAKPGAAAPAPPVQARVVQPPPQPVKPQPPAVQPAPQAPAAGEEQALAAARNERAQLLEPARKLQIDLSVLLQPVGLPANDLKTISAGNDLLKNAIASRQREIEAAITRFNTLRQQLTPQLVDRYGASPVQLSPVPSLVEVNSAASQLQQFLNKVNATEASLKTLSSIRPTTLPPLKAQEILADTAAAIQRQEVFGEKTVDTINLAQKSIKLAQSITETIQKAGPDIQALSAKNGSYGSRNKAKGIVEDLLPKLGVGQSDLDTWKVSQKELIDFVQKQLAPFVNAGLADYHLAQAKAKPAPVEKPKAVEVAADALEVAAQTVAEEARVVPLVSVLSNADKAARVAKRVVDETKKVVPSEEKVVKRIKPTQSAKEIVVERPKGEREIKAQAVRELLTWLVPVDASTQVAKAAENIVRMMFVNKVSLTLKDTADIAELMKAEAFNSQLKQISADSGRQQQFLEEIKALFTIIRIMSPPVEAYLDTLDQMKAANESAVADITELQAQDRVDKPGEKMLPATPGTLSEFLDPNGPFRQFIDGELVGNGMGEKPTKQLIDALGLFVYNALRAAQPPGAQAPAQPPPPIQPAAPQTVQIRTQVLSVEVIGRLTEMGGISDQTVSRVHAEVTRDTNGNIVFIRDLNSTNGTFVNRKRVTGSPLTEGDLVNLGGAQLQVARDASGVLQLVWAGRPIVGGVVDAREEAATVPVGVAPAAYLSDRTKRMLAAYDGQNTAAQTLAEQFGYSAATEQIWLYPPAGKLETTTREVTFPSGRKGQALYKLHVSAAVADFDRILSQMTAYLREINIYHKVAPGTLTVKPEFGSQYGKAITIYATNPGTLAAIAAKAQELARSGLVGIPPAELQSRGANLAYELPVPGTNNILYYTIEDLNGNYLGEDTATIEGQSLPGYAARAFVMRQTWGQGPLDNLWPANPFETRAAPAQPAPVAPVAPAAPAVPAAVQSGLPGTIQVKNTLLPQYEQALKELPQNVPQAYKEQARLAAYYFQVLDTGEKLETVDGKDLTPVLQQFATDLADSAFAWGGQFRLDGKKTEYPNWKQKFRRLRYELSQSKLDQINTDINEYFQAFGKLQRSNDGQDYYFFSTDRGAKNARLTAGVSAAHNNKMYIEGADLLKFTTLRQLFDQLASSNLHPDSMKLFEGGIRLVLYWNDLSSSDVQKIRGLLNTTGIYGRGPAQDPVYIYDKNGVPTVEPFWSNDSALGESGYNEFIWEGEKYTPQEFIKQWLRLTFVVGKNPADPYRISFIPADPPDDPQTAAAFVQKIPSLDTAGLSVVVGTYGRGADLFNKQQVQDKISTVILPAQPPAPVAPAPAAQTPVSLPEQFTVAEASAQEARVLQQDLAQRYPGQLWAKTPLVDFDLTFVARNNQGKIVGVIQLRPVDATSAYIDLIEVDPNYQNKGVGKQLLDAVKAREWSKLTLSASPLDISETAPQSEQDAARERLMQYYEGQGFSRVQPQPNEPIKIFGQMIWQKPSAVQPQPAAQSAAPTAGQKNPAVSFLVDFGRAVVKLGQGFGSGVNRAWLNFILTPPSPAKAKLSSDFLRKYGFQQGIFFVTNLLDSISTYIFTTTGIGVEGNILNRQQIEKLGPAGAEISYMTTLTATQLLIEGARRFELRAFPGQSDLINWVALVLFRGVNITHILDPLRNFVAEHVIFGGPLAGPLLPLDRFLDSIPLLVGPSGTGQEFIYSGILLSVLIPPYPQFVYDFKDSLVIKAQQFIRKQSAAPVAPLAQPPLGIVFRPQLPSIAALRESGTAILANPGLFFRQFTEGIRNAYQLLFGGGIPPPPEKPLPSVEAVTQRVLAELSIDQARIRALSQGQNLLNFITKHLIDTGFQKILPTAELLPDLEIWESGRLVGEKRKREILSQYQNNRQPIPVFRSFVLPKLLATGYHLVNLDLGNLFSANEVGGAPKGIVGDYLIYNVVAAIERELGQDYLVVRTGGDEFAVATKQSVTPDLTSRITAAAGSVQSLYREGGRVNFRPAQVKVTTTSPADLQEETTTSTEPATTLPLGLRVNRLKTFHPELAQLVDSVLTLNDPTEISDTLKFMEEMLYDPTLNPLTQEFIGGGTNVEVFVDPIDYLSHLKQRNLTRLQVLRIDLPGVLKALNDTAGYDAGNAFLQWFFRQLVPAASGISPNILVYRRGADFYLALPNETSAESAVEVITRALIGTYQAAGRAFPLIPAVVATRMELAPPAPDFEVPIADELAFAQAREDLDSLIWQKILVQLKTYYTQGKPVASDWQFLAAYFNPYDRRGSLRLARISGDWVAVLKPFYEDPATGKTGVKEGLADQVHQLLTLLLTGQPAPRNSVPTRTP